MLENSLKIRGKFINKLVDKLEDLNSDLILLGKLDKKIYKKNNSQKGGNTANITQLQLTTYMKEQELKEEQQKLTEAIKSTGNIGEKITKMNQILQTITNQIQEFQIKIPALTNMNVDISALEDFEMKNLKKRIEDKMNWNDFSTSTIPGDDALSKKVGQDMYNKLIKNPAGSGEIVSDDDDEPEIAVRPAAPAAARPVAQPAAARPAAARSGK